MEQKRIIRFIGGYAYLSNFYRAPVTYNGLTFGSAEAAFQAQKCVRKEDRAAFTSLDPRTSKSLGNHIRLREDWEDVKIGIMEDVVREKFRQSANLTNRLLATENAIIEEGNTWNDTFWGVDIRSNRGENHLGKILMKVRSELGARQVLNKNDLLHVNDKGAWLEVVTNRINGAGDHVELYVCPGEQECLVSDESETINDLEACGLMPENCDELLSKIGEIDRALAGSGISRKGKRLRTESSWRNVDDAVIYLADMTIRIRKLVEKRKEGHV